MAWCQKQLTTQALTEPIMAKVSDAYIDGLVWEKDVTPVC